ncbi:MAG TPA: protein nirF [Ectothiorhodospiraceae bacterium]|nr:protein nirF [Ectothiorhodospiraceae bacterium]
MLNRLMVLPLFSMIFLTGCLSIQNPQSSEIHFRATGDMGLIIERAIGKISIVETTTRTKLSTIGGLGDLSHASAVYSRDERFAYIFGRDGGLTKVDMLSRKIVKRIIQAGNSIGGAISQDGSMVAVSNYTPGGVKVFRADTLELLANIPAVIDETGKQSKVVGLVDAPGNRFVFSLYDGNQTWILDMSTPKSPQITKFKNIGLQPYDALITPDGRYYLAGLYGEDGLALLDLWHPERGVKRVLADYGRGNKKMPVYKMPHLEGWAMAGHLAFIPAVGRNQVIVMDTRSWKEQERIDVHGQPVFVMARPDGRHVWVNFAFPNNDTLQIIDVDQLKIIKNLKPGKAVLHMEFTPRGEEVWVSVRDEDKVRIYDTQSFKELSVMAVDKPSGIFFTARAHKIGL